MPIHPPSQETPRVTWPRYIVRALADFFGGVSADFDAKRSLRRRQDLAVARIEREAQEIRRAIDGPGIDLSHLADVKGYAPKSGSDDLMWELMGEGDGYPPLGPTRRQRLRASISRFRVFLIRRI